MIVTINKEIKLSSGTVLKEGTKIVAIALSQPLKGGSIMVVNGEPYSKNTPDFGNVIIGVDDVDKISIAPEVLTNTEKDAINRYLDALDDLTDLGL